MALNNLGLGILLTAKDLATNAVNKLDRSLNRLDRTADTTAKSTASSFAQVGTGLALFAAGAKGLSVLGGTVADAKSFEKAIAEVAALTDEASFSTEKMRKLTMELAETFGFDAIQQAPALYQTISAGVTDAEGATKLLVTANKLAVAGVADLTTTVDVLTSALNNYDKSGLSAADASDILFVAMRFGKTTITDMGQSLGRVAPVAADIGISFSQLGAIVAAATKKLGNTRTVVSGLNAALANIKKPTQDAVKEAKRLEISFNSTTLRGKGFQKFINDIVKSPKFAADSLEKLFGSIEGGGVIAALAADQAKFLNEAIAEMGNRAGATDAGFKIVNATLDRQLAILSATWKNIKIGIGTALLPLVKTGIAVLQSLVDAFKALPGPVQRAIVVVFGVSSALLLLGGMILLVKGAMVLLAAAAGAAGLTSAILFLKGAIIAIRIQFLVMAASGGTLAGVLGIMKIATLGLLKFALAPLAFALKGIIGLLGLLLSPFVLVAAVIAGAIALIIIFWDEIQEAAAIAIEAVVNFFSSLFDKAVEIFGGITSFVADNVISPIADGFEFLIGLIKDFLGFVDKAIETVKEVPGFLVSGIDPAQILSEAQSQARAIRTREEIEERRAEPTPAVAALQAQTAAAAAAGGGGGAPNVTVQGGRTELTSRITVELNDEVLAEAVEKQMVDDASRRSQAGPGGID